MVTVNQENQQNQAQSKDGIKVGQESHRKTETNRKDERSLANKRAHQ
jgi:hypothetical protein